MKTLLIFRLRDLAIAFDAASKEISKSKNTEISNFRCVNCAKDIRHQKIRHQTSCTFLFSNALPAAQSKHLFASQYCVFNSIRAWL